MANVKINNNTYMNKEKVKLVNADDESQFVTFSIGGGGGDTSIKKVLYTTGSNLVNMLSGDYGKAYVEKFPTYQTITKVGEYFQQTSEGSNKEWSTVPSTITSYYYGESRTYKDSLAGYESFSKLGISRFSTSPMFIIYDDVTLQDTGVTIDIGGYTFYEAIVVGGGE